MPASWTPPRNPVSSAPRIIHVTVKPDSGAARARLMEHPVRCPEKAARKLQQLAIGGMICSLHALDLVCQLREVLLKILYEFVLCLRGADNQHFMRNGERFGHARIEVPVFRRFAAAH